MAFDQILFYLFSAVLLFSAVMVITQRNPVHAVLFLVLAFFNAAGLWLLLEAEFLAIALVLVYVGAVMVLFLFVVMMLDIDLAAMRAGFVKHWLVSLVVGLFVALEMIVVVGPRFFGLSSFEMPARHLADYSNTEELGQLLYTVYMYPFEIAAVILLVAIIAAIGLTLRRRPETKTQDPGQQVQVRRADRVRLVKMPAEQRMKIK